MRDTLALLWRQYRFERHLFWRNPSAAFFNFLLPLIFLALFGAIFSGDRHELQIIVPGIAGMSVMSTTFTALAYQPDLPARAGRAQADARHAPAQPTTSAGWRSTRLPIGDPDRHRRARRAARLQPGLAPDRLELLVFVALGVMCFASLGVALSHAIPNFDSAPAWSTPSSCR